MKKSTVFLLILIAFLFVSLLFSLYLNYNKFSTTSILTPTSGIIPTETIDETTDWRTYSNNDYFYEFKCPSTSTHNIQYTSGSGIDRPLYQEICFDNQNQVSISVTKYFNTDNFTLNGKTNELIGASQNVKNWQETEIGGYKSILYQTTNNTGQIEANYTEIKLNNEKKILIRGFGEAYYTQILSTFKFTDSTFSIPKGWKTYTNTQYHYSINYPESWDLDNKNMASIIISQPSKTIDRLGISINTTNLSIDRFLSTYIRKDIAVDNSDVIPETVKLNNVSGTKISIGTAIGAGQSLIYVSNGNNSFIIEYFEVDNKTYTDTITQILSTFKFTESNEKQLSYVTINYPKYNLSFRMPKGWYFSNDAMNGNYKPINSDVTIDSNYNMLFFTDNLNSKIHLTVSLDPDKPEKYSVDKQGDSPEFEQIISSIKFTP